MDKDECAITHTHTYRSRRTNKDMCNCLFGDACKMSPRGYVGASGRGDLQWVSQRVQNIPKRYVQMVHFFRANSICKKLVQVPYHPISYFIIQTVVKGGSIAVVHLTVVNPYGH